MEVECYRWDNIELAPEETGIYAWYLDPVLREADLGEFEHTKQNLIRLSEQLRIPDFDLIAKGHLSLTFKGSLEHDHLASGENQNFSSLVEDILEDKKKRNLFSFILSKSLPHLMAPLYIGVAVDVRQRLKKHKEDINKFRERARSEKFDESNFDERYKFALEVVRRGIPSRHLSVFVTKVTNDTQTIDDRRKTCEGVETILNRLFYPIMGRR